MVHSVNVLTIVSMLPASNGSFSADRLTTSTGNGAAAIRLRASRADVLDGSTPMTFVTAGTVEGQIQAGPESDFQHHTGDGLEDTSAVRPRWP